MLEFRATQDNKTVIGLGLTADDLERLKVNPISKPITDDTAVMLIYGETVAELSKMLVGAQQVEMIDQTNENILVLTVGLPRSGKSLWAKGTGLPVVNPDAIRLALHGQAFVPDAEAMVWAIARYMVKAQFVYGHKVVILDATNINNHFRDQWLSSQWKCVYKVFDTPADVCVRRAMEDGNVELWHVIEKMAPQLELPTENLI